MNQTATGEDERCDLQIRGFWARGADCILDVGVTDTDVTDTDAKSYCKRAPAKVLEQEEEKEKKRKYLEACLDIVTSPLLSAQWLDAVYLDVRPKPLPNVYSCQAR
jgi:hypothetical protein